VQKSSRATLDVVKDDGLQIESPLASNLHNEKERERETEGLLEVISKKNIRRQSKNPMCTIGEWERARASEVGGYERLSAQSARSISTILTDGEGNERAPVASLRRR
jgi:hypothetical protein